jgi:hypothetical protein
LSVAHSGVSTVHGRNEVISSFQKSLNVLDANIVSSIANFDGALARAASATIIICIGAKGAEEC